MTTLPNWLLGIFLILAAYGVAIMAFVIWMRIKDWRTKRNATHKDEDEYKDLYDWMIEEIEKELQRGQ